MAQGRFTGTDRLRSSTLWIYGMLGLPVAMIGYPVGIFLPHLYAAEAGVALSATGLMVTLARVSDAFTDPLMGFASDRFRTPFGRRKPWILFGVPVLLLGAWMLFHPSASASRYYLLVWYACMTLGLTFILLPYSAWGAELSTDYHTRTRIQHSREVFVLIGLMVAATVPFVVQDVLERGSASRLVLHNLGLVILVLLPAIALLVASVVPEPEHARPRRRLTLRASLRLMSRNGLFRMVLAIELIVTLAESFRNALSLFFIRDCIGIPNVGRFYVVYFGVGLVAMPLWTWLAGRVGKHLSLAAALALVSVVSVWIFTLDRGDVVQFYILFGLKGFCFGAFAYLPRAMLADVVDVDSARSGDSRAGSYFAVHGIMTKGANALGPGLSLPLLELTGYQPSGGTAEVVNTAGELLQLAFLYAIVPTLLFFGAMCVCWRYPLTRERHRRLELQLQRKRARLSAAPD